MRRVLALFAAVLSCALPALAADDDMHPVADVMSILSDADCGRLACRPAGSYSLAHVDHSFVVAKSPYVTRDGAIVIYPGESLTFDFPDAGDTPGAPRYISNLTGNEPNALTLTFGEEEGGGHPMMMLHLKSGLKHTLKINATVTYLGRDGLTPQHGSICALMPGLMGVEMWPQPLGPMVIDNFRFAPDGAMTMSCD